MKAYRFFLVGYAPFPYNHPPYPEITSQLTYDCFNSITRNSLYWYWAEQILIPMREGMGLL